MHSSVQIILDWAPAVTPQIQATSCRTSQMCTLSLACRKPVSWGSSVNHIFSEGCNVNIFTIFAGLRHDYISMPASRRGAEPSAMFPSYFDTSDETIKLQSGSTPSSSWKPGVPSSSPSCQALSSLGSKYGCQSPKLSRLQQQVTQFKLLKLAQSQGTHSRSLSVPVFQKRAMLPLFVTEHCHLEFPSNLATFLTGTTTVRTRSPLRTSLRSLQAVRNSRSFETDDHQPADPQITDLPPGGQNKQTKIQTNKTKKHTCCHRTSSLNSSGSFFFLNNRRFLNVLRSITWKVGVQVMVSLHETHGNVALSESPWEKTTEVAICQPLQDPPLRQRSSVNQWTCFCLAREKDHSSLGHGWAVLPWVKGV